MEIQNKPIQPNGIDIAAESARFMTKVYAWMTIGIVVSGAISYYMANSEGAMRFLLSNPFLFYGLIIAELGAVFFLSAMVKKISGITATFLYLFYAALSGATLSVIFMVYTKESITQVFGLTAFSFAGLSAFGLVTKRDLGPVGAFCTMGLWGVLGYGIMTIFFPSWIGTPFDQAMALMGVVVFAGLTAYDTQKIKQLNIIGNEGTDEDHKEAIMGALTLYLDFVNLFLQLLRILGKKK